jgi:uncharacterized repeat protein (TIGR03803 family)
MLFNWPRLYFRKNSRVRKPTHPCRRPAFRPHVEHLENRVVPATTSILHSFAGPSTDGASPSYGGLMADSNGNLFGTTSQGGTANQGTVFELVKSGNSYTQNILYSFAGGATDGASPYGGLVADSSGNLFGTTQEGGAQALGTVFELVKNGNSYTENVLYSFAGGASDGAHPDGTLIMDGAGNLFGTTHHGGGSSISIGVGTVFEMVKNGSNYNAPTILHGFAGGADGSYLQFGVIADASGNLFGTTNQGGDPSADPRGNGTVFELVKGPSGYTKITLYAFASGTADGSSPYGTLIMDASGNLFGATHAGGTNSVGTVYELAKSGSSYTETVLYSFAGGDADGGFPDGGLVMDSNGNLFGTTALRGQNNNGTVFELVKSGNTYTESVLHFFAGPTSDGSEPASDLIMDVNGNIFGTTIVGGASGKGTVFEVSVAPSLTHNQRFVTSVYQQLLNRAPEPAGLAHWTGQLDSGISPSAVVLAIETAPSNEYLTDLVIAMYQHYLKRAPDAGGLQTWVNRLVQSGSIAGTVASIVSSPEYFANQGGTNTGFVNGLYTDVLGRAPDPGGQAFWVEFLNGGGSRNQAPLALQNSKEYLTDLVNGGPWTAYDPLTNWGGSYPQFLHRTADSDGLNYYVSQLMLPHVNVVVLAAIFGSPEGYAIWS